MRSLSHSRSRSPLGNSNQRDDTVHHLPHPRMWSCASVSSSGSNTPSHTAKGKEIQRDDTIHHLLHPRMWSCASVSSSGIVSVRTCSGCGMILPKESFSKRQWEREKTGINMMHSICERWSNMNYTKRYCTYHQYSPWSNSSGNFRMTGAIRTVRS